MTPKEAQQILELLARGIDPATGESIASIPVLNSPQVIRALFLGAAGLDGDVSHGAIAPSPKPTQKEFPKAGKSWTQAEENQLIAAFDAGLPIDELALSHQRSKGGIAARLVRLGKISERSDIYVRATNKTSTEIF